MIGSLSESVDTFVCLPVLRMGAALAFVLTVGGAGASVESTLLAGDFLATPFFAAGAGASGMALLAVAVRALVTRVAAGIEEAIFVREDALVALGLLAIGKEKLKVRDLNH